MMLMFFQQWSGVNSVIFYTVHIFLAAKISMSEHLATNIIGLVQLLATAGKVANWHAPSSHNWMPSLPFQPP